MIFGGLLGFVHSHTSEHIHEHQVAEPFETNVASVSGWKADDFFLAGLIQGKGNLLSAHCLVCFFGK